MNKYGWILCIIIILLIFFRHFRSTRSINEIKRRLAYINPSFKNIPIYESDNNSHTTNKSIIFLCLKDPKTSRPYDINIIMYVVLHEIAHTMSKNYTVNNVHDEEFNNNFNILLNTAILKNVYDPSIPVPRTYCGLK